ncbi:MAG: hypothetical protein ACOX3U_05515 [Christensenellales bacterium]|jgi:hypothetical protein
MINNFTKIKKINYYPLMWALFACSALALISFVFRVYTIHDYFGETVRIYAYQLLDRDASSVMHSPEYILLKSTVITALSLAVINICMSLWQAGYTNARVMKLVNSLRFTISGLIILIMIYLSVASSDGQVLLEETVTGALGINLIIYLFSFTLNLYYGVSDRVAIINYKAISAVLMVSGIFLWMLDFLSVGGIRISGVNSVYFPNIPGLNYGPLVNLIGSDGVYAALSQLFFALFVFNLVTNLILVIANNSFRRFNLSKYIISTGYSAFYAIYCIMSVGSSPGGSAGIIALTSMYFLLLVYTLAAYALLKRKVYSSLNEEIMNDDDDKYYDEESRFIGNLYKDLSIDESDIVIIKNESAPAEKSAEIKQEEENKEIFVPQPKPSNFRMEFERSYLIQEDDEPSVEDEIKIIYKKGDTLEIDEEFLEEEELALIGIDELDKAAEVAVVSESIVKLNTSTAYYDDDDEDDEDRDDEEYYEAGDDNKSDREKDDIDTIQAGDDEIQGVDIGSEENEAADYETDITAQDGDGGSGSEDEDYDLKEFLKASSDEELTGVNESISGETDKIPVEREANIPDYDEQPYENENINIVIGNTQAPADESEGIEKADEVTDEITEDIIAVSDEMEEIKDNEDDNSDETDEIQESSEVIQEVTDEIADESADEYIPSEYGITYEIADGNNVITDGYIGVTSDDENKGEFITGDEIIGENAAKKEREPAQHQAAISYKKMLEMLEKGEDEEIIAYVSKTNHANREVINNEFEEKLSGGDIEPEERISVIADDFYNTLPYKLRQEFQELFMNPVGVSISRFPQYVLNGDNTEFFKNVIKYIDIMGKSVSFELTLILYEYVVKLYAADKAFISECNRKLLDAAKVRESVNSSIADIAEEVCIKEIKLMMKKDLLKTVPVIKRLISIYIKKENFEAALQLTETAIKLNFYDETPGGYEAKRKNILRLMGRGE